MRYRIMADGNLVYDTSDYANTQVLDPNVKLEVTKSGNASFTMMPGHPLFDAMNKMKTKVLVHEDDNIIFSGRVLYTETDIYKQRKVYCEGALSYLIDTLFYPGEWTETLSAFFQRCIREHNAQADADKQLVIGNVTIKDANLTKTFKVTSYGDVWSTLQSELLDVYGGYLRIRTVGTTNYIDYLSDYGHTSTQTVEFGNNIIDLTEKISAEDLFTVLYPVGYDKLTIAEVNGGSAVLENADGVAKYGRIIKAQDFSGIKDAAQLKAEAQKYMDNNYKKSLQTLTLKVYDLHLLNVSVESLHIGDMVRIVSTPHGIDVTLMLIEIDLDIQNPESSSYTFGTPDQTLSDKYKNDSSSTSSKLASLQAQATGNSNNLNIVADQIKIQANDIDIMTKTLDVHAEQIELRATTEEVGKINTAVIELDGEVGKLDLWTSTYEEDLEGNLFVDADGKKHPGKIVWENHITSQQNVIDISATQTRVSSVESDVQTVSIRLDSAENSITLKANQVDLDAQVTRLTNLINGIAMADKLWSKTITVGGDAWIPTLRADTISPASTGYGGTGLTINCTKLVIDGSAIFADQNLSSSIRAIQVVSAGSGSYKIQYKNYADDNWHDASSTFSSATTLAGTWSGGTFTVSASPQGKSIRAGLMDVTESSISWDGNIASVPIYANLDGGETRYYTGKTVYVNAQTIYNTGFTAGQNDVYNSAREVWAWPESQMTMYQMYKMALAYYDDRNDRYVSAGYHYWYYSDDSTTHRYYVI